MDCPQCRRECGQNDKFCSECGYRLCSARTPVTELSVPGKETGDSTDVSSADLGRVRRNGIDWHRPNLDLQPGTECTVTVSTAMEEGVLNNATPKTFNRKPSAPERVEATDVQSRSVTLCWKRPVSMEGVSHEIHITYGCEGEEPRLLICAPNTTKAVLTDRRPGMKYTFNLTAVLPNGICSKTSSTCTETRKKITMATSSQIVKVTKGLTTAAECREDTKLLMQPYANWEDYLTPAPMSIAILAELVFISSNTDFSIRKGGPEGGFKYIKYPDSFRACLMQVCHSGWYAFNAAHKNMDKIRLYTNNVPNYIKLAVKILLSEDDDLVQAMLPEQLNNIKDVADECLHLAESTEKSFTDVIELICELLETCTSAKRVYGKELEEVRKTMDENKLRKAAAEEATKRAEEALKNMSKQLEEAQESFKSAMDSIPSGWDIVGMNFVEGLSNALFAQYSAMISNENEKADMPTMKANSNIDEQQEEKNQISANNIYARSALILPLVEAINDFFDGDQIKWSEITDQKTKEPKTNWAKEQFVKIQEYIKKENECKPKNEALELCTKVIKICSKLGKRASRAELNAAETKEIVQLMRSLEMDAVSFDTKSKSATNASAFPVKPPQITKMQENSSGHKSAGRLATDNARLRIEQNRVQLEKARESYEKNFDNMEVNKKALTDILVIMRNCEVKEIDFTTTIKILSQGLEAMGNVKDQWQKLVRFFQMVSNLMKTSLTKSLKEFAKTGETASNKTFKYTSRMFLKDMIYNQVFYASNIASLVNMIAGTYTEVSDKYLMDGVSKLSMLMSLDAKDPRIDSERRSMAGSCYNTEEGIRKLVKENKQNFERKTVQRQAKIEGELKAVLPPESEEKKRERKEVVEKASKYDPSRPIC